MFGIFNWLRTRTAEAMRQGAADFLASMEADLARHIVPERLSAPVDDDPPALPAPTAEPEPAVNGRARKRG